MMSLVDLQKTIQHVSFFPGVDFKIEEDPYEGFVLIITATVPDSSNPDEKITLRILTYIPPVDDVEGFMRWLTWRLARIASHEVREWLKFDGVRVFDPHTT